MVKIFLKLSLISLLITSIIAGFNVMTRGNAIEDLIQATEQLDQDRFSNRFNWQDARNFTTADLIDKKQKTGNNFDIGPSETKIPELVDFYLQDDKIPVLFYFKDALFPDLTPKTFIRDKGFYGLTGFYVTIGYPVGYIPEGFAGEPPLSQRLIVRVLFELDGLTWKIVGIKVPLFMMPKREFDAPEQAYQDLQGAYQAGY